MNRLYYGDCLTVMQDHMRSNSVDLIYLDPPFNSQRDYNQIYKDETGRPLPDQVEAFCDTWKLDSDTEKSIRMMPVLMRESGVEDSVCEFWRLWMNALRETNQRLLAYLSYMVERLLHMKSILKPTGSIYLHCDPTASHYIKVMMDAIFGHQNFVNEIVWRIGWVSGFKTQKRGWIRNHDVILYYVKSPAARAQFNKEYIPYAPEYRRRDGKKPTGKGIPIEDTWNCSDADRLDSIMIKSFSKEKLGYATQKTVALLERIIRASSNEGDVVFDPFCGCATTLEAAHRLNRRWIGIDIAIHAIKRVTALRLRDKLGLLEGQDYTIEGVPQNIEGARDLWERDKYHFQKWAVEEVDGFVTTKRTGDGGVDGRLYFDCPGQDDLQSMAIEVKGGKNVGIRDLRALHGVVENDLAMMGGLIVLEPLGDRKEHNFRREMAQAGDVQIGQAQYPRLQLLTVAEIFAGKRFDTPGAVGRGMKQPQLRLVDRENDGE